MCRLFPEALCSSSSLFLVLESTSYTMTYANILGRPWLTVENDHRICLLGTDTEASEKQVGY